MGQLYHEVESGVAAIRLLVDGLGYSYWVDEDPRDFSSSFSHRGGSSTTTVRVASDDGTKAAYYPIDDDLAVRGWWKGGPDGMDRRCARAIQIAIRNGSRDYWIKDDELQEVYVGPAVPLIDELPHVGKALAVADYTLVTALLAVGCTARDDDRELLDDWVASHANEITAAPLASWLNEPTLADLDAYKTRSAFQVLVDLCAHVNVDLGLDTVAWDERLKDRKPLSRPWGVPPEHWWWRQGRLNRDGSYWYPRDDD